MDKAIEAAADALKKDYIGFYMSDGYRIEAATMAIAAYLAQREADGFVMVPVEPTPVMLMHGDMGLSDAGVDDSTLADADACYRAMLAARPQNGEG